MSAAEFMATCEGYFPEEFGFQESFSPEKKLVKRIELRPAAPVELTVLTPAGKPAIGARVEYIGPNRRGSVMPIKPADQQGIAKLKYPELGKLARWRVTHQSGTATVSAADWPNKGDASESFEVAVRLEPE